MYDVIEKRAENGQLVVRCISDEREMELIKKYQDQSDRIVLDFFEAYERPDLAASYGVNNGSGQVFLEY